MYQCPETSSENAFTGRRVEEWVRASSLHTSLLWRERKIYLMPTDEVKP